MNKRLDFLRESIRNLKITGSVARSSRFLCRRIARKIISAEANVVVELGPGDGAITRYILDRLQPDAQILVFEVNEVFIEKLQHSVIDPRITLIHDSAENIAEHLAKRGIKSVDYFISGIPFMMLPDSLAEHITKECHRLLRPNGQFIQFHYSPKLVQFYKNIFGNAEVDFIPLNFPPAFVITCKKEA